MDDGRFVAREGTRTVRRTFEDFEDLILASWKAQVDGSPAAEQIIVIACRATVSAGSGAHRVRLDAMLADARGMPRCSTRRGSVDGGRG